MDVKIGFSDTPRELVISVDQDQEALASRVSEALQAESGVLDLTDTQGRRVLVRNARIAYVEVGTATAHPVGFARA